MQDTKRLLDIYALTCWEDLILPTETLKILNAEKQRLGYRLLLHSSPGTGKTSTGKMLAIGQNTLYLSGSNNFNTAKMTEKVIPFASGQPILGKPNLVIIDECENIADKLQDSFKIILDKCNKTNFIFITNELPKVNEAICSRSTKLNYDFLGSDLIEQQSNYIKFALRVCKEQNIQFVNEGLNALYRLNFPDFRHLLVNMQEIIDMSVVINTENVKKFSAIAKQNIPVYEFITNPAIQDQELYNKVSELRGIEREILISLGEPFFEYLNSKALYVKTIIVAEVISKYCGLYTQSINKFATLFACIVELKSKFR